MGSIPLPALDIGRQQAADPLGDIGKVVALRQLANQQQLQQQDLQIKQQQVRDLQATTAAMMSWDPKSQTYDELAKSVLAKGGSANAATAIQQHGLDIRAKASQVAKLDAETGETNLKNLQTKNDLLLGAIDAAKQVSDEQLVPHVSATLDSLGQQGLVDPQFAGQAKQLLASGAPPKQIRQQLDILEKGLQGQKGQFDLAAKQAETFKNTQQGAAAAAEIPIKQAQESRAEQLAGPNLAKAQSEATTAAVTAKNAPLTQKLEQQQKQASAASEFASAAHTKLETQMMQNAPAGLQGVQPHLITPAANAYAKTGEEYASAKQASDNLKDFITSAKSGNKEAVRIVPLQGALEITTAQGVHRINRAEVDQFGGAGSLYDKLAGKLGGMVTGKNITDDVLNDMSALQQTIDKNAITLHTRKVDTINTTYGSHFKPMDFSQTPGAVATPAVVAPPAAGSYWSQFPVHK